MGKQADCPYLSACPSAGGRVW